MTKPMHNPTQPGEILAEFMAGRTVTQVARHIGVSRITLSRILHGHASVTAEMSLRLARAFQTNPTLWLDLQTQHDVWLASQKKLRIKPLPPLKSAA